MLRSEGLESALKWLAGRLRKLYDLNLRVASSEPDTPIDQDRRISLFQIVRELLFNVIKHADINEATVSLRRENGNILMSVEDGGKGFDSDVVKSKDDNGTGLGLSSIRERLSLFDGEVEITSSPGKGCKIVMRVPAPTLASTAS